jgi:hypothetical protein
MGLGAFFWIVVAPFILAVTVGLPALIYFSAGAAGLPNELAVVLAVGITVGVNADALEVKREE